MKNSVQAILIIVMTTLLVVSSCVPQQKAGGRRKNSGASTGTTPKATPNPPEFADSSTLFWYSGNNSFENIITVNEDIATVIYLRGESINDFLNSSFDGSTSNLNRTYCLVASYNTSGAKQNLRVRAVPISFTNFTTGTQERLLRVDLPDASSSVSTCSGNAYDITTTVDAASTVGDASSSFSPPSLCSTCKGIISSTDVSLYLANSPLTVNDRIPESSINLNDLVLRIDTQSGSLDQSGSCSDSACLAKGFDCCLEGQCVDDGALRPNASSQSEFTQALADVAENPNNFINWPAVYFVCGAKPPDPIPTPTPLPDASSTADARLQELIKDFNCLEEGKLAFPDFAGSAVCEPNFDQDSFKAVRSKVWAYCGCEADPFPTDPEDPVCPDFGLEAIRDINDNIIDVVCFTPPPPAEPTPFQSLSLGVNTRSAPHRFYRADTGEAVNDITTLDAHVKPEGTPFQYTDGSAKTGPDCSGDSTGATTAECNFNLNSVLGQFNVELNQARPATVVNLDFDQSYIISAISGYYTPCPTCASDYWFQSFTAFPSSQDGVGLQATSYTTNRSVYGNNTTLGNYADTQFGRACFVPPTMLPFSHKKELNVNEQRQNRLLTQTALWINGYQKDWFGFNKGALIGSFDGVSWFAIGRNRRVTSDTGKLFLAINAPFADLTDPSDIIIQIVLDQGSSVAPLHDYDPNISPKSSAQGTAATCQYWHQCETDTDCITKLGWEYMCLDTGNYKYKWPKFNVLAEELANEEFDSATFSRILESGYPSGNRKRCVYRGNGAICKRDFKTSLSSNVQKHFSCAPNFHCANLESSEFNTRVARTPNKNTNIIYGLEADILGRPLNYAEATGTLPDEVVENIRYNAELYTTATIDLGLCRPGRKTTVTNHIRQHEEKDSGGRADYISQVGSCNSSLIGTSRVQACPLIQREPNQSTPVGDIILSSNTSLKNIQNSCGGESLFDTGGLVVSPFETIEADPIRLINNLVTPSLAKDACLRRPGSVCHTDLDCSPNRLHAALAIAQGNEQFGGTDAEHLYWQEELVCSQAKPKPLPSAADFFDYDMSKNRCCREVGKDFTMFTRVNLNDAQEDDSDRFDVTAFPYLDPQAEGRYSRYAVANTEDTAANTSNSSPYPQAPIVDIENNQFPRSFQWKTINDTGSLTCCGGGWIRKFVDGTTNWNDSSRLKINPTNFACLNYHFEVPEDDPGAVNVDENNFIRDIDRFCLSPLERGCSQITFPAPTSDGRITVPLRKGDSTALDASVVSITDELDTKPANTPNSGGATGMEDLSFNVPFEPLPYANDDPLNENDPADRHTFFFDYDDYFGVSFYLPSYIGGVNNINSVVFDYYNADGTLVVTVAPEQVFGADCTINNNPEQNLNADGDDNGEYCIISEIGKGLIFHGRADKRVTVPEDTDEDGLDDFWTFAAVRINFNVINGQNFIYPASQPLSAQELEGSFRGNDLYYLTKLGRLELLGVPQMFYEPIYCNTNRSKLVDGIFNFTPTREQFFSRSISMAGSNFSENGRTLLEMYDNRYKNAGNTNETAIYNVDGTIVEDASNFYDWNGADWNDKNERFVFRTNASGIDQISLPQIFSENEFRCCTKLGEAASENAKCCSGHRDAEGLCKLPKGADLHVYFNKFISGEGMGSDLPGGGLTEDDFIPETGEPKISSTVLNKIRSLGTSFCESGEVRGGSAFGFFYPEPNNGSFQHRESVDIEETRKYSIIDSTRDFDPDNESGTSPFLNGFRWDHHLYCAP